MRSISELIGKTLTRCEKINDDRIEFDDTDGNKYALFHMQDCCESVAIDDICGWLGDLIGEPIIQAEEVGNESASEPRDKYDESFTWTFYRLATRKGFVTIRWYGSSNGYYSESVDFSVNGETN